MPQVGLSELHFLIGFAEAQAVREWFHVADLKTHPKSLLCITLNGCPVSKGLFSFVMLFNILIDF